MLALLSQTDNWWMLLLWLAVFGVLWWRWQRTPYTSTSRLFVLAVGVKAIALAAYLVYSSAGTGGGDLIFFWSKLVPRYWQLILEHPEWRSELLGYLLWNAPEQDAALQAAFSGRMYNRFNYPDAFEMLYLRLVLIIRLASAGNLGAGLLLSTGLGLLGQWWVFRTLSVLGHGRNWLRFLVVFGIPSVGIYTTAFHKETFILFGFGLMTLGIWQANGQVRKAVFLTLGWLIIFCIKAYLALLMLPFLAMLGLWALLRKRSVRVKAITLGGIGAMVITTAIVLWDKILFVVGYGRYLRNLALNHGDPAGNRVDIGEYTLTLPDLILASLKGMAATLFGPLPGHIQNIWGWAMVLDNLIWVGLCAWLLYQCIGKRLRWLATHWLLVAWPLFYSIVLGLSVPYYGSLLRYRTLAVLLLVCGFYVFYATATPKRERF